MFDWFVVLFFSFDTQYIIKYLLTETSGKQYVLWTLDCRCFPRLRLGKHRQSLVHKTYCFPRSQSISVNCVQVCILGLMLNMLNMASARYLTCTLKCIWHRFARCTFEIFETRDLVKNSHTFQSKSSVYSIWLPIKVDYYILSVKVHFFLFLIG